MKVTILQRNIEWANPTLNVQRADGGGDYPEAVHKALETCDLDRGRSDRAPPNMGSLDRG